MNEALYYKLVLFQLVYNIFKSMQFLTDVLKIKIVLICILIWI